MTGGAGQQTPNEVSELVLIRLRPDAGPAGRSRVEARLATWGAKALVSAPWGWIAQLPQAAKAPLAADRAVATVGGVQPSGRTIPRIRVPASTV